MNVKFTRPDGTDCYTGTIKHEVGEIITAPDWKPTPNCGNGLHFAEPRVGITVLSKIPGKVFEVEPIGQVIEISPGKKKAQSLKILRELDLTKLLSQFAEDKHWYIRVAVAKNPNISKKILLGLAKDEDVDVRRAAIVNLNQFKK